jgi:formylglycine-generating enzyme required for sulfatase activity
MTTTAPAPPRAAAALAAVLRSFHGLTLIALLWVAHDSWGYPAIPDRPLPGATRSASLANGATMRFVWVDPVANTAPGGAASFAPAAAAAGQPRRATVSQGYYLGQSAVTLRQWQAVMGATSLECQAVVTPSGNALRVSWAQVQAFIAALNQAAGEEVYRLPTAAEWEYASRGGLADRWAGNDDSQLGQYARERVLTAAPGGNRPPNPWGLAGMAGDQPEWVAGGSGCFNATPPSSLRNPEAGAVACRDRIVCSDPALAFPVSAPPAEDPPVVLGARLAMVR